jgi:Uma2 family endonuclease
MRAVWLQVPETFLEERRRLGQDKKDELWDGELHMVPPPSLSHQRLSADLLVALAPIAKRLGLQFWADATGVYGPGENWRIPDVTLARPDQGSKRGLESAELVVEILSDYDESRKKFPFYAKIGVSEVWLIDPATRATEIYTLVTGEYASVPFVDGRARSPRLGIELAIVDGPRLRLDADGSVTDV